MTSADGLRWSAFRSQLTTTVCRSATSTKLLYPLVGFTKAQVIDYYVRVAPVVAATYRGSGYYPATMARRGHCGVLF